MILKIITIILLLAISNLFGKSTNDISMFTEQYPPYNMMIDGKLAGTSIEVLDAMLKQMKSKQSIKDIRMGSWARGYTIAQKKKNAMVFSAGRIKERENLFKWVDLIGEIRIGIIAEKKQNINIKTISDLNPYRIVAVRKEAREMLMLSQGLNGKVNGV